MMIQRRYFVFLRLVLLIPGFGFGQNLVVNGGFEEENVCTEYKVACAPEGWFGNTGGFKNYLIDSRQAYSGEHFLAIEAGRTRNKYQRSYTRTQLLCNLRAGKQYRLQFFVKSANNILDSIGVYFSHFDFLFEKSPLYSITPSAYIVDENRVRQNDTGWQKVIFNYTAKGDEEYITIANFSRRDINGETGVPLENHFFVFVDAVSLEPADPDEKICADWAKAKTMIYEQNDRHEFLERTIRFYRMQNKMADPPKLSVTRIVKSFELMLNEEHFLPGKFTIQNKGLNLLNDFCLQLGQLKVDSIIIEGMIESKSSAMNEDSLPFQKANSVKVYLSKKLGLAADRISTSQTASSFSAKEGLTSVPSGMRKSVKVLAFIRE